MKRSDVSSIEYNGVYEYITFATDAKDFMHRMKVICVAIIDELARRIERLNPHFPLQAVKMVDDLNDEVSFFTNAINKCDIVADQPKIQKGLLLRLIKTYQPLLYNDYNMAKNVLPN